jgi:hypothetical protein
VLIGGLLAAACGGPEAPHVRTEPTSAGLLDRDAATGVVAEAICSRYHACEAIGAGAAYPTDANCTQLQFLAWQQQWRDQAVGRPCARMDAGGVHACGEHLRALPCDALPSAATGWGACHAAKLCR